jgi:hypothetical protein
MSFLGYLKEQIILTFMMVSAFFITYHITIYMGWRRAVTTPEYSISCVISFIIVGTLFRYFLKMPPRNS